MLNNVHTTPLKTKWAVKLPNKNKPISTHRTQAAAVKAGRTEAMKRGAEHFIHGRKGQIREKNSYGNDPVKTKG